MAVRLLQTHRGLILFIILAGFFITNTVIAEMIGGKIFSLEKLFGFAPLQLSLFGNHNLGLSLTAGAILWPIVFVMTDIINEYYGKKAVKFLSYLTVGLILYGFIMIYGAIYLPADSWWQFQSGLINPNQELHVKDMNTAFNKVMGTGLWIIIGSMVAFLVGQVVDVSVFHKIKQITGEQKIWLRATGSTLVSQLLDSYVVIVIAFWIGGDWDLSRVLAIGTVNYIYKGSMAIILTPILYLVHFLIDKSLGKELSDEMKRDAAIYS